ncbi:zinc transporter ZIP1 [Cimex lectularius]|uniref:Fe2+/Zn2+ regulated transporter n=1 Tax=Cimex lectularius TaxID=79782 RepID=A0A8I6RWL1_CIMLE|nr:zinc transporter ZIP1 [Cimex lectularius]
MWSVFDLKLLAILLVTGGSILFGVLPSLLGLGTRYRDSVLLSALLCFGGGVLLSTSIVHILPDTRKNLNGWAEIVFCSGFMLIYLSDVILNFIRNWRAERSSLESLPYQTIRQSYGSISHDGGQDDDLHGDEMEEMPPELKCSNFSLIFAFSLHSLLEGLVIGVEPTVRGVLLLLLAVCCHKLLVAFCLGSELIADGRPTYKIVPPLSVFAVGSAAGIALGFVFQPDKMPSLNLLVPILQDLAGGTLLYVVMCEILPRERRKNQPSFINLVQYFAVLIGFSFMAAMSTLTEMDG